MEESFPALGAGPAAAPKGAWGKGDTAAKLQKLAVQGVLLATSDENGDITSRVEQIVDGSAMGCIVHGVPGAVWKFCLWRGKRCPPLDLRVGLWSQFI